MRQLAAAAGDGWLGSVGSPGQLETSLNSGYTVGPCNSYSLEGPTPTFVLGFAAAHPRARIRRRRRLRERKSAVSLITPPIVGRARSDARQLVAVRSVSDPTRSP